MFYLDKARRGLTQWNETVDRKTMMSWRGEQLCRYLYVVSKLFRQCRLPKVWRGEIPVGWDGRPGVENQVMRNGRYEKLIGAGKHQSGISLIETVIAMSILFIGLAGIVSAHISSMRLRQVNAERALSRNAAEQVFSGIRGMPGLVDAYQRFGGGGPEETFDVRGLQTPAPGQPVGRVIVWRLKNSLKKCK